MEETGTMKRLTQTTEASTGTQNRRRRRRLSIRLPLTLTWMSKDGVHIRDRVVVENISEKGALVRTRVPIPPSARIQIGEPMTQLCAAARVVRVAEPGFDGLARIGIEFLGGRLLTMLALLIAIVLPGTTGKAGLTDQKLPDPPVVELQPSHIPDSLATALLLSGAEQLPEMPEPPDTAGGRGPALAAGAAEEIELRFVGSAEPGGGTLPTAAVIPAASQAFAKLAVQRSEAHSWQIPMNWLKKNGITLQISQTADWSKNLRGGESTQGSALRHLLENSVTMESDRLGWKGGLFFASAQIHAGRNGSLQLGDFQGFSNIDAEARNDIFELWFQQTLLGDKIRLKAGKTDANSEFAFAENAADFLNSSMGYSPTIVDFPTYPFGRMGINVFAYPRNHVYGGFGWYDLEGRGSLFIAEGGKRWASGSAARQGRLGAGIWDNTASHERFDGQTQEGTRGFYLVLDQALWAQDPGAEDSRTIRSFFQYGHADAKLSEAAHHIGGGMEWTGAIPQRKSDAVGVGATLVRLSQEPGAGFDCASELALETFYKLSIRPWMQIAPDFQYIRHPGGSAARQNSVVGTVRLTFVFDSARLPSRTDKASGEQPGQRVGAE
jgi:porin